MKRGFLTMLAIYLMLVVGIDAQEKWWPSEWGAEDQRGAANRLTPAKVIEASKLIKTGQVYQLGKVYENGMPLFGSRHIPPNPMCPSLEGSSSGGVRSKNSVANSWTVLSFVTTLTAPRSSVTK